MINSFLLFRLIYLTNNCLGKFKKDMSKLPFPVIARKMHFLRLQLEELASEIVIHEVLPNEIFIMILKKLSYSSINISRETCKHWKGIIDRFELVKAVMFKYFFEHKDNILKSTRVFIFSKSKSFMHPRCWRFSGSFGKRCKE